MGKVKQANVIEGAGLTIRDYFFRKDKVALRNGAEFLNEAQSTKEGALKRVELLEKAVLCLNDAILHAKEMKGKEGSKENMENASALRHNAYALLATALRSTKHSDYGTFFLEYPRHASVYGANPPEVPHRPKDPSLIIVVNAPVPAIGATHRKLSSEEQESYSNKLAEYAKAQNEFILKLAERCEQFAKATPSSP